jgi:hypothetical protein
MFKFFRRTCLYILIIPVLFTFLGALSNQIVLQANHDTFPVMISNAKLFEHKHALAKIAESDSDADAVEKATLRLVELDHGFLDDTHIVMTDKTHFNFLADVFDFRHEGIESIGDLLLKLGEFTWTYVPFIFVFAVIGKLKNL